MPDCPFCLANGLLTGAILGRDRWCHLVETGDPV